VKTVTASFNTFMVEMTEKSQRKKKPMEMIAPF